MKVAFLSDIHANYPALVQALELASRLGAERVLAAGDAVGSGPHAVEVIRLLRQKGVESVMGNVDRKVLALLEDPKRLRKLLRKKHSNPSWTASLLGPEEHAWLSGLPFDRRIRLGEIDVLVTHGSPLGDCDYVYPSITADALASKLGPDSPGLFVCGHSHVPFTKAVSGIRVVNCGTVGKPVDGDPRGSLALVEIEGSDARARIHRFAYPSEGLAEDLRKRGAPDDRIREFLEGRKQESP